MKYSSKKIVLAMLTVFFAVLLMATPMTALAATDYVESASGVNFTSGSVSISSDEAQSGNQVIHTMTVSVNSGYVSSFEMTIGLPGFVDAVAVKQSEQLAAVSENGVFEWNINKETRCVSVAYSSPNMFSYIPLFDIEFTVNDYSQQSATPKCASVRAVDTDYNELITYVNFGEIAIGSESSAMMGDVDGNGEVNLADLLVIQRSIVNPNYPLTDVQFTLADINRDGMVNIVDCQYIQNYLVGRLGSLENVGQQTGQVTVEIFVYDQDYKTLYMGKVGTTVGESYGTAVDPILKKLSLQYTFTSTLAIYSEYYGEIGADSVFEDYAIKGDDTVKFILEVDYGTSTEPSVVYTFNTSFEDVAEDGTVTGVTTVSYTFYSDGTVHGVMQQIVDGKVAKEIAQDAIWLQAGSYIDVTIEGETERLFVVDESGNLSIYEGDNSCAHEITRTESFEGNCYSEGYTATYCGSCGLQLNYVVTSPAGHVYNDLGVCVRCGAGGEIVQDWVQYVELDINSITVTVGASKEEMLSKIVGLPLQVCYSQSGLVTVPVTVDMLNYEKVALDTVGSYEMVLTYVAEDGSCHGRGIWVNVIPDMSEVPLLGTYKFDFDGGFGFGEFALYEGGTAVMDGEYFTTYRMMSDGVAAIDMDGGYLVFALGEGVATFYDPSAEMGTIGTYVYKMRDGLVTVVIYGDYTDAGDYVATMRVQETDDESAEAMDITITTTIYIDIENHKLIHVMFGAVNFDEAGNIYCPHENVMEENWEGDCWSDGYHRTRCENCYEELSYEITTPAGHIYNENRVCTRCGQVEYIEPDMVEWTRLDISNIGITVGADKEELLSKIVGQILYVNYSKSGLVEVVITEDMLDYGRVMLDSVGEYEMIIIYTSKDGGLYRCHLTVHVNPDMSEIEMLGVYKITEDMDFGFTEFVLYADGTAVMNGGYYDNVFTTYYTVHEGVVAVDMEGGYLVLSLGDGTACFHDPAKDSKDLATYFYSVPFGSLTVKVFGEYTGAGNYVAVMSVEQTNPETGELVQMSITTVVYLDQESCEIHHVMFGNMYYDEAGNIYCPHNETYTNEWEGDCYSDGYRRIGCSNCGEEISYEVIPAKGHSYGEDGYCVNCGMNENGVSNDLNDYKNAILEKMMMEWSDITSSMPISEQLQARFNTLTAEIKMAETYDLIDSLYQNEFRYLCDEARTATNVYLVNWDLDPDEYHVSLGTTIEQFIAELVKNMTITVYYSDGTSAIYPVTEDMLKYNDLDLSVVGRTYISISYHDELTGSGIGFGMSVYVDPDMTGAELLGSYTYTGETMNGMEWERADLYSNGIMMVYEGDYYEYVEYVLDGDVLSYVYYDNTVFYRIVNEKEITLYTAEQMIGKYTYTNEDGEGFTVTFFGEYTGAGDYKATIEIFELCNDGSYEYYGVSTVATLDMEAGKFGGEMMDGFYTFDEQGVVTPMECEHEFDETGYCHLCGSGQSGSASDSNTGSEEVLPEVEAPKTESDSYVTTTEGALIA